MRLIEACEVGKIAGLAGIDLYGGTMLEGPVGSIASAHVFATFETLAFGTELFGPLLLPEEILKEPLRYENFELHLPTAPGLGIEIDEDKIGEITSLRQQDRGVSMLFSCTYGCAYST